MMKSLASLLVAVVIAGLVTVSAFAQDTKLVKSVVGAGGSVVSQNNTEYMLNGVTGQAVIETKSDQTPGSGSYDLNQGFWIPNEKSGTSVNDEPIANDNGVFNYPNPVRNSTTIEYNLDAGSFVTLKIYDMVGNEIKVVQDGFQSAGTQRVEWNAKNDMGVDVGAGSYLYELQVRSAAVAGSGSFDSFNLRNVMVVVR
jgi:hypothetical protein